MATEPTQSWRTQLLQSLRTVLRLERLQKAEANEQKSILRLYIHQHQAAGRGVSCFFGWPGSIGHDLFGVCGVCHSVDRHAHLADGMFVAGVFGHGAWIVAHLARVLPVSPALPRGLPDAP